MEFKGSDLVTGLVVSLCAFIVGGFSLMVIRAGFRLCKQLVFKLHQRQLLSMPESMRLGSDLVTDPPSRYEWLFGVYSIDGEGNNKIFLASGVIINGFYVTCHHAIADENLSRLYVRTYDNKFHKVAVWAEVEADIVVAPVTHGYKSAKIRPLGSPTHAKIISAKSSQNSSFGVLKHEREMCGGRLSYSGSTVSGFSGSPYTNGQQILGIHLGGGTQGNYGVSASLIYAATTKMRKPESSELLALSRALRTAKRSEVYLDVGQDDVRVDVNGRFFYLTVEDFDEVLKEEEFLDHFLEEPVEDKPRYYRRNWKERKHLLEEPDYVPEGTREEEESFLGLTPLKDSPTGALKEVIDSLATITSTMESMKNSMDQATSGLRAQHGQLEIAFMSMQQNVEKRLRQCEDQATKRLISLESRLDSLTESNREPQVCQDPIPSTSSSKPSSERLIPKVAQDSEISRNMQLLEMRWDGMESDIQKYAEWRSCNDSSRSDFVHLREAFLVSLGLTIEQKKALIARYQNLTRNSRRKQSRKRSSRLTT